MKIRVWNENCVMGGTLAWNENEADQSDDSYTLEFATEEEALKFADAMEKGSVHSSKSRCLIETIRENADYEQPGA